MELVTFSVTNYRSITNAYKLPIRRPTVLIGPNNEGKSNILRALVVALRFLSSLGGVRMRNSRVTAAMRPQDLYDWQRDFPVSLQEKQPDGATVFDLEFRLSDGEVEELRKEVRSNLNGTLPIQVTFGGNSTQVFVTKQGKGAAALTRKSEAIARFVARHINIAYIPAVRTATAAYAIVGDLVDRELAVLEERPEYIAALDAIAELQTPLLKQIASNIQLTLKEFLPNIKDVVVEIADEARHRALRRSCEVLVNDGTSTPLDKKGDGVQSLAALSLMKHASHAGGTSQELVLAIEEPESHLHPKAIHQLRGVLDELSKRHQVILTTHCPLFIDRTNLRSNILVNRKKANPAKSISELRDILGVRASDNLRNAELVLIVEGEEDRRSLEALLAAGSKKLSDALSTGFLAVDSLGGGSNLSYKLGQLRDSLCTCHVLLDHDKSGRDAASRAQAEGLIAPADVTHVICPGLSESEFEDMLDEGLYADFVKNRHGAFLASPKFKGRNKWSDRMKAAFAHQGKVWSAKIETALKRDMADLVVANPGRALNPHKRGAFDGLAMALEEKLELLEIGRTS